MRLTSSIQSLFRKLEWDFTFSGRCVGDDRLDLVELLADLALGDFHIITVLEIHPELCGGAEGLAETQRRIGGDPGRLRRDALDAGAGQVTSLGERRSEEHTSELQSR